MAALPDTLPEERLGGSTLRSSLTISSSELLPSSDASMSSVRSAGVPYLDVLDETGDEEVDDGGGRGRTLSALMGRDSRSNLPASSRSLEPDVADSAFLSTKGLGGVRAVGARRGGSFGVPVSRLVRAAGGPAALGAAAAFCRAARRLPGPTMVKVSEVSMLGVASGTSGGASGRV